VGSTQSHLHLKSHNNINKFDFFSYSSPVLYKSSQDLVLINSVALPLKKRKIIFNFKKMGKTLALILLAIVIKSICQYYLGAQETSLEKIFSGLDFPFYQGCILGGVIMVLFQDNWNNMWDFLHKSFTIKLDSEDEDSGNEALNLSQKDKDKLTDSNIGSKAIDKGKNPEQVTSKKGSPEPEGVEIPREELMDLMVKASIAAYEIAEDTKSYNEKFFALGKGLQKFNSLELGRLNINNPADIDKAFFPLLKEHGVMYSKFQSSRLAWIVSRAANLQPENKPKVRDAIAKMEIAREKYLSAIKDIGRHQDTTTQAKIYYAALNEQRNSSNKELNKAEDIVLKDLKASPFCTIDHDDCKNLVKTIKEYYRAKIEVNTQDNNLKKKLGEVINRKS
jgi:hypothetical protein